MINMQSNLIVWLKVTARQPICFLQIWHFCAASCTLLYLLDVQMFVSAQITVYVQSRLPLFCVHFITHRHHQATSNSLNRVSSRGQIGMERSRLIELEEKANSLQGKIGTQRKAMGGVNAAREANIQVALLTVVIHILVLTRA